MRAKTFLQRGRAADTSAVVVCAGDSITHGQLSANYLQVLESDLATERYEFVNAGVSGDLSENLVRRLDTEVLACQPDVVTVLIGTNDVAAHISEKWMRRYHKQQKPLLPVTRDQFVRNVTTIVHRVRTETSARVALIEIPLLTEDLTDPANERVREYNRALHELADASKVPVVPLYESMVAALPAGHVPPRFDGSPKLMLTALLQRMVLRRRWDAISARHRFALLTDHVHLNDTAARILAELIEDFLGSCR